MPARSGGWPRDLQKASAATAPTGRHYVDQQRTRPVWAALDRGRAASTLTIDWHAVPVALMMRAIGTGYVTIATQGKTAKLDGGFGRGVYYGDKPARLLARGSPGGVRNY